jgi:nicotinate-nucleotide pyrophosphorylase (carboxylating)
MELPDTILKKKLKKFLNEDIGYGDITTNSIIEGVGPNGKAKIFTRQEGVVSGLKEAAYLFEFFDVNANLQKEEGVKVQKNDIIMELEGPIKGILACERTALNLLMRMSGIATATYKVIKKVREVNSKVRIACTRKTTPGFRYFEKKAVQSAGGDPHRYRLDDMVLIKDNHLKINPNIQEIITTVRKRVSFSKKIEIEVTSAEQALDAAKAKVDILMLDNFKPLEIQKTIDLLKKSNLRNVILEVSGNITQENIVEYAKLDIDVISMGTLTHSAPALDITLDLQ